jgi:hypothetical protein
VSGLSGAVVLVVLIVAALLVLLVVAGLGRAASREMPKPPRSDRDA